MMPVLVISLYFNITLMMFKRLISNNEEFDKNIVSFFVGLVIWWNTSAVAI